MQAIVDGFITGLIAIAAVQLKVLASNIEDIGYKIGSKTTHESLALELKKCINHHQAIIRVVNEIERIFEIVIFVQCCTFACIVCVTTIVMLTVG